MAFQDQQSGDIHATLAVSQEEARFGSSRVVNLPGGRTTTVIVPAGVANGQELRLTGQGVPGGAGSRPGDLILRVLVVTNGGGAQEGNDFATERAFSAFPGGSFAPVPGSDPARPASILPEQGFSLTSAPTDAASNPVRPGPGGPQSSPGYGGYQAAQLPSVGNPGSSPNPQPYPEYGYPTPSPVEANRTTAPGARPYPEYRGYPTPPQTPLASQTTTPDIKPYPEYSSYPLPPQTPTYPQSASFGATPVLPPTPVTQKRSGGTIALVLVAVAVILAASGLGFYFGYYQPQHGHAVATQTAQAQTSTTAGAQATGTSLMATATANINATGTAQVKATAQVYQNIYTQATKGTPVLDDALSTPSLTSLWNVVSRNPADGECVFTGGAYHSIISKAGFFQPCYALNSNYSNFAYQVDMTISKGDGGGMILRASTDHNQFYLFRISTDGSYSLYDYKDTQGGSAALLLTGSSPLIKGLNQSNEITIVARQSTLYIYINRQYLGSASDNTYKTGQIGLFAESLQKPTEVAFSHAKVWTL